MKSCSFVFIDQTTRRQTTDDRNFNVGKTMLTPAVPTNKIVGIITFGYCYTSELEGDVFVLGAWRLTSQINFRASKGLPATTGWKTDWSPTTSGRDVHQVVMKHVLLTDLIL